MRLDQQTFNERQDWDRGSLREHKGVIKGMNVASTIVEELAQEENQAAPSNTPGPTTQHGDGREAGEPPASPRPRDAPPPGSLGLPASWPGGHSRFNDYMFTLRMRPFKLATAGAGTRSTIVQQDQHQVATGPGGGGIIHGPEHGAGHSGARPSNRTSTPGRPASGRAGPITSGRQRAAESVDSLVGFEEKDEAHLEAYEASHNQPGPYVDLESVLHGGPRTGVLGEKEAEAELLEGAQEDHNPDEPPHNPDEPPLHTLN